MPMKVGAMATRKSNKPWDKTTSESSSPGNGWGNLPSNLRPLADLPGELNTRRMGEIQVLISVSNVDLGDFSDRVWSELNTKVLAVGGQLLVTREELVKYFATAIKTRIDWVNHDARQGSLRPNDKWALPVAFALVVSAVGIVDTPDNLKYVPVWNPDGDSLVLTRIEWEDITRRLLAYETYGLRFVKAIEVSEAGVDKVMTLIPVQEQEDVLFYSWVTPHVLETIMAIILGVSRFAGPMDVSSLPLDAIPKYRIRGSVVLSYMHDFARMNEHRDVA